MWLESLSPFPKALKGHRQAGEGSRECYCVVGSLKLMGSGGERGQLLGLWVPTKSPLTPVTFIFLDTATLLFLAMPMLAVGGILFLITNLQV